MNNHINQIDLIKKHISQYDIRNTDIYISKKMYYIEEIKDAMGNQIFNMTINLKGWLVFIDPSTDANWSHKCTYCFIFADKVIHESNCNWFPSSDIDIEKIEFIK